MEPQPRSLRGLKALVGILGLLVVLGTVLVIGVVIQRIYAKPPAPSMITVPAVASAPAIEEAEHVAGIAAAGDYVAVWETGPQGDRILSINLATGAVKPVFSLSK